MTARDGAGHLGDHEGGKVQLGMMGGVFGEGSRDLLRRGDADVDEVVAMNAVWVIDVQQRAGEIGAVVKEQIEVADVPAVVVAVHELKVLFGRRLDFEAVDSAVVRCADELGPLAVRSLTGFFACGYVRCVQLEVVAAVAVAEARYERSVGRRWNVFDALDRLDVRNEGNREPIVAVDLVVAADDGAGLAGTARAKTGWSFCAHMVEVD